jgi:hypothetical protein
MRRLAALVLSLFLTAGMAVADTPKDPEPKPAKAAAPAKPGAAKKAEKADSAIAAEIEELRREIQAQNQAIHAQREELQLLKEELAKRDRQIDDAREAATAGKAGAAGPSGKAIAAVDSSTEVKSTTPTMKTAVSDFEASREVLKTTATTGQAETQKAAEEGPNTLKYKGITITPGGFVAAESVFRTRAVSGDINTPFTGIPYPGNALANVTENNFTARQSRLSLLAETKMGGAKVTGYYEADWLGTGVTSNNRESNSYVFRQRVIYGQVALESGWSFTGGQQWSLATENRKGIQNRQEAIPLTIDSQYQVGFTWARQYAIRVVKDFGGMLAFGVSLEGPQATIGGRGFSQVTTTTVGTASVSTTGNTFINAPGSGGGLLNFVDTAGYSVNKVPDVIVKAAVDPGYGHYEVLGIFSTFRNRVYPCGVVGSNSNDTNPPATPSTLTCAPDPTNPNPTPSSLGAFNDTVYGGGGGVSARLPLFPKKLDFAVKGVAGDGIGRYGSAQLADLTFRPDGTQAMIRAAHGLGELEFHPSPKLDVYVYYGAEYALRAAYRGYNTITITKTPAIPPTATTPAIPGTITTTLKTNQFGGYGSPFANNSGCSTENPPANQLTPSGGGSCAGDTRIISEATFGFWHKFYQGPKGGLRWGLQYSYFSKNGYSGANGIRPHAVDNMVWTSFRYYLP